MFDSPEIYFPEYIRLHARYHPHKLALVVGEETVTWGEMEAGFCRVANALLAFGVRRHDRVAVLGENSVQAILAQFGIIKMGAAVASLSGGLSKDDLAVMINDAEPELIFVSAAHAEKVDTLRSALACVPEDGFIALDFTRPGWRTLEDFLGDAPTAWEHVSIEGGDTFYLTYSSGTTSVPKGIVLTHRSRVQYFQTLAIELGFTSDAVVISGTALYSTTTWSLLLVAFLCGATIVVQQKFDAAEYCELADTYHATHTIMVPAQYDRVLELVEQDPARLSSMRMTGSTGSTMTVPFKQRMMSRFPGMLYEVYGMTEGIVTVLKPSDLPDKIKSVGRPMLGNDFRILDSDNRVLPNGEPGEIVAYAPSLLREYYKQPAKTAEATWIEPATGRTFLRSGDIGAFDDSGYLYLVDRKKDMIVSGGFNIYPADIEAVLTLHPQAAHASVIGVPHERWGETPLGLVILKPGATATSDEIRAWVNERLGKYQRVSAIEICATLPRNAGGKVLKRELRARYWPANPAPDGL